jgi:hypothetical protein
MLLLLLLVVALLLQADIMDAPNALAHIVALMSSEQAPMCQAAATCLGNLTEHQTRLGTTQVSSPYVLTVWQPGPAGQAVLQLFGAVLSRLHFKCS